MKWFNMMLRTPNYMGYPRSCTLSLIFIETLEMYLFCSALRKKFFARVMLFSIKLNLWILQAVRQGRGSHNFQICETEKWSCTAFSYAERVLFAWIVMTFLFNQAIVIHCWIGLPLCHANWFDSMLQEPNITECPRW